MRRLSRQERDDVRGGARIVGAEIYFQGEPYGQFRCAAARGRQVTLAMEQIFVGLSDVSRSTPLAGSSSQLAALRKLWQENASVLALEPAAAALRQTLTDMGVISAEDANPELRDSNPAAPERGDGDELG